MHEALADKDLVWDAFISASTNLTDFGVLEVVAENIDPERAAQKWRDNPPDDDYDGILDADEVRDGSSS